MAKDYTSALALARRLIRKYGRQMTLKRIEDVPADANKPWEGSASPRATYDATTTAYAVTVPPDSLIQLGISSKVKELDKPWDEILIMEPNDTFAETLDTFDIINDGKDFKISWIEKFKPGDTTLMYFFGVCR